MRDCGAHILCGKHWQSRWHPMRYLIRANTSAASSSRYQPNTESVCRLTKRTSGRTVAQAARNATTVATMNSGTWAALRWDRDLYNSYMLAAGTTTRAAKKEYSVAVLRSSPLSIPPRIVEAERDMPDQRARHW